MTHRHCITHVLSVISRKNNMSVVPNNLFDRLASYGFDVRFEFLVRKSRIFSLNLGRNLDVNRECRRRSRRDLRQSRFSHAYLR